MRLTSEAEGRYYMALMRYEAGLRNSPPPRSFWCSARGINIQRRRLIEADVARTATALKTR